jgi:hypothetical protein
MTRRILNPWRNRAGIEQDWKRRILVFQEAAIRERVKSARSGHLVPLIGSDQVSAL